MNSSCSEVFKTVPDVIFIMSGAHLIWIFVICFLVKACKLKYSWFWHLTFRWLCWALHWLFIKVSVRYQNRPCLGREWVISHQYLRRFRSNNRVLQNNAFNRKPCRIRLINFAFKLVWRNYTLEGNVLFYNPI